MKIGFLEMFLLWFKHAAIWFKTFKAIRSLGDDIYNKRVTIDEADQEQIDIFDYFCLL